MRDRSKIEMDINKCLALSGSKELELEILLDIRDHASSIEDILIIISKMNQMTRGICSICGKEKIVNKNNTCFGCYEKTVKEGKKQ